MSDQTLKRLHNREKDSRPKISYRPKSYSLKSESTLLSTEAGTRSYLCTVDRLVLKRNSSCSSSFNNFHGQPVLKVLKSSNRILLLKDLHDNTLWNIQISKFWLLQHSKADVMCFYSKACEIFQSKKAFSNLCIFQFSDL